DPKNQLDLSPVEEAARASDDLSKTFKTEKAAQTFAKSLNEKLPTSGKQYIPTQKEDGRWGVDVVDETPVADDVAGVVDEVSPGTAPQSVADATPSLRDRAASLSSTALGKGKDF